MASRLKATEFASEKPADFVKAILAGLRLVGTGLALRERLQQPQYPQKGAEIAPPADTAKTAGGASVAGARSETWAGSSQALERDVCVIVKQSVSLLCERVCEAALQRAQADAASKVELVAAEVYVALSVVLALRAGLTRLAATITLDLA